MSVEKTGAIDKNPPTIETVVAEINYLHQTDDRLNKGQEKLWTELHSGFELINHKLDAIKDGNRLNPGLLISLLALLLTAGIALGTLALSPLQKSIADVDAKFSNHIQNGHPWTVIEKIENLEDKLNAYQDSRKSEVDLHFRMLEQEIKRVDYYGSSRWKIEGENPYAEKPQ